MTRTIRALIILAVLLLAILAGCVIATAAATVNAAPPCALYSITPINAFANIRSEARSDRDNITGRLNKGESIHAAPAVNGWYAVATGGFVSASVVTATCAATQVAATVTRIPLPTATATATPTQVTKDTGLWIVANGVAINCGDPCKFEVRSKP